MLKIFEKFDPRANPIDGNFPTGSIKNETVPGANDGTPLDADWGNDYVGADAALMAETGLTPSGDVDTVVVSDRLKALKTLPNFNSSIPYMSETLQGDSGSAVNDPDIKVGKIVITSENTAGDGGGAAYLTVLTSSVTPNPFDIVVGIIDNNISFQLIYGPDLRSSQFGAPGLADATPAITRLVEFAKTLSSPSIIIDSDLAAADTLLFDVPDESTIKFIGAVLSSVVDAPAIQIGADGLNVSRVNVLGGIKVQRTSDDTTGTSVGVRLHSLVWCVVDIREATGFADGVLCDGIEGNGGFSYNEVHLGRIQDNLINCRLTASGSGFCNENNFYGGSFSHSTGYAAVATTNLVIDHFPANNLNNNRFYGPSLEGKTTLRKAATINGTNNSIYHPRMERSGSQSTFEFEFTSNSLECGIIAKGFTLSDSNITDNGTNNYYVTRQGEVKSFQTAAIAGSTPVAGDERSLSLQSTASNDACILGVLNSSDALTYGIMGNGFAWSTNRVYAETGFRWSTSSGTADDRGLFNGTGSPEGVLAARTGSMYLDRNGGASTTLYVKESGTGNTGWVAK